MLSRFFLLPLYFLLERFRLPAVLLRALLLKRDRFFADFQICYNVLKPCLILADKLPRAFQNIILQAQTFGNGKRIALARYANQQAVSRPERFYAEFTAGIFHAFRRKCEYLQFTVMRCHSSANISFQQGFDNCNRQCRTFRRVCSRAQFIEQHKRIVRHFVHNAHNVRHVRGERAQALLNALFIANIGKYLIKNSQLGMVKRRDMQPSLPHKRKQPQRFQRNSFAARIWTGNQKCCKILTQINVNRHNCFRVQDRVPCFLDIDIPPRIEQRLCAAHGKRKRRLGKNKIQLCQQFQIRFQRYGICCYHIGKRNQYFLDFLFFSRL